MNPSFYGVPLVNLSTPRHKYLEATYSPTETQTFWESSLLRHPSTGICPPNPEKAELTPLGDGERSEYATVTYPNGSCCNSTVSVPVS